MTDVIVLYGMFFLVAIALIFSAYSLFVSRKTLRFSENRCEKLTHDLDVAQSGAIGMGKKILALEKRVNRRRSNEVVSHIQDKPYAEASNLFSLGIDKDEVARRCSLSRGEVSLLETLQKHSARH